MNTIKTLVLTVLLTGVFAFESSSQSSVPSMNLKAINGAQQNTSKIFKKDQPVLIVFWASWCDHTKSGLNTIQEDYIDDWSEEYNLKIVAICVDDSRTLGRAITIANSNAWDFDVYLDSNGEFKRAMGVNNAPHIILLDKTNKIAWQRSTFLSGDEELIQQELVKL